MTNKIQILGNEIDCFKGYKELYEFIIGKLNRNTIRNGYVTVNNVHTMMEGYWNPSYQAIINNGYLSIPDGKPLEIVGRLKGNKEISRLFGPTLMENFIDWGRKDGISHFFFGSSEANLQKLITAIEVKFPGLKIAGKIAPPYAPIQEWDNELYCRIINEAKPDFIWVGLGAPKQEHWMFQNVNNIEKGVMFGIGAGFDYLSGNTRHAPNWIKNLSLEWLYRLIQEPQRLWKRYLTTIPPFIVLASLELIGVKFRQGK